MKFKKSILSSILASVMVLSTVSSSLVFADTVDYSTSVEKMQQLGILDKSISNVNAVVTRAELVKSIAIVDGLASTAANLKGSTIFADVASSSDLSGYVNGVVGAGYMFGMPDGNFHPEQGISYAEAATIFVRLLGYGDTDKELSSMSWPSNYIQEAYNLKLTTGLTFKKNDKITYNVEAVLFDRLLNTLVKGSTSQYFSDKYFADQYLNTDITGKLVETTIVGNSKTSDDLSDNQVYMAGQGLADKVKYTVNSDAGYLEIGAKYKLYLDGSNITKVSVKENSVEDYAVTSVVDSTIAYNDDNKQAKTMTLPKASLYYYHGVYVDYDVAVKAVRAYSSIILAKKSDNSGYDYGVIIDANFGQPQIYKADNTNLVNQLKNTEYAYIYRQANIQVADLHAYDVVYFVSDIWNKNTFIYVYNTTVYGSISAFIPNILNPTGLTVNKVNYTFSKYFNKSRLSNYDGSIGNFITNINFNDSKTLVLGIDGTIVDIY